MKLLFASMLFFSSFFALAGVSTQSIQSEKQPIAISPQYITHFSSETYADTYVSTVISLVGGAWLSLQVYVSVGFPEEGEMETFSFTVMGEIVAVDYSRLDDDSIIVQVKTSYGSFDSEKGTFNEGNSYYFLKVSKDSSTGNGFATQGPLTTMYFDVFKDN